MPTNVQLQFEDTSEPIAGVRVHRLEYIDSLNQPFSLTLGLTSSDPSVEPAQVLGKRVIVDLEGEPWLSRMGGIVVAFRQRTALTGLPNGESAYEAIVRPPLWLLARRFGRRVHQNVNALEVIAATLAALGGIAPAPVARVGRSLPTREYTAQYDETDLAFVRRLLAESHLVAFFDWAAGGAWTIVDALGSAASLVPSPLVYRPPTGLIPSAPHALALTTNDELAETHLSLRDYNFEHPQLARSTPAGLDGQADVEPGLPNERTIPSRGRSPPG